MMRKILISAVIAASVSVGAGSDATAQSYPIDCAIILCLAGGWPASAECTSAKAEFIRRATPFPVEPPVQPWNCPMQADAGQSIEPQLPLERLYLASSLAEDHRAERIAAQIVQAQLNSSNAFSGSEFDFIHAIRVWHIRFRQSVNKDGECRDFDNSRLGSYDHLGNYAWTRTSLSATPARFGLRVPICNMNSSQTVKAVVVEWASFEGVPGFEVIHY